MATKQTRLTPFGRKVRKRLIDKNMTQVELAALLGCNKQCSKLIEALKSMLKRQKEKEEQDEGLQANSDSQG